MDDHWRCQRDPRVRLHQGLKVRERTDAQVVNGNVPCIAFFCSKQNTCQVLIPKPQSDYEF